MLEQRPGLLRAHRQRRRRKMPLLHTSRYDFNDENLTVGAAYWTRLVETYLA